MTAVLMVVAQVGFVYLVLLLVTAAWIALGVVLTLQGPKK